jgi:DNA-binding NarL/FixJ family response regulator
VFSYREKQVLELVLAGLTNGEIAGRLYLSESTVKSHLASSFRKLGVSSRVEAARRVLDPDSGLDLSLQPLGEVPASVPAAELV